MALAQINNVKERVIRILNANPSAWSSTVAGDGSFPDNNEIERAILEADEMVVTQGYFQSMNPTLMQPFMVFSANIPSGDKVPFYKGKHGKVMLSTDNFVASNIIGQEVNSPHDIINAINFGSYVGAGAYDHLFHIDKETGIFLHSAQYGKIELPTYTRTSALQCQQSEETLVIATAIRLLTKHATPAAFDVWAKESVEGLKQLVTDGKYLQQNN